MAINELLDELENLVVDARRLVFTNKCIIEEDDLMRLIDGLRKELPQTIKSAEDVINTKQTILDDARSEAARLVEQAKEYGTKMTAESEIVGQARMQAKEIMDKTLDHSNDLKNDSINYANQVFDHLIGSLDDILQVVHQAKGGLNEGTPAAAPSSATAAKQDKK
ncbi:ATP synthase subunit B family protein [Pectinatus haikarae]|uniref:Vacuolar-type H+-ATPase subunit H n=1 Tax=Pectinatus haikarae TaxID=349096 RepID=A0ABT9Y495_9FIRM|nr:ATPase [Pectinatus haikarae]MDQ0202569.1 vacuolar-type H+-ATPase subunit H [Pectinatus haikarae]